MRRTEATAWVVSVCAVSLRLSQAKTLAALVAGALSVQRVSLANIGRALLGNVKHQIKRCWRFCANDRVETADAMRGVVKITHADRLERLLLILAIAYLLLCGVGLVALRTRRPCEWTAKSKNDCSVFMIGRVMISRITVSVAKALQALIAATKEVAPNWG